VANIGLGWDWASRFVFAAACFACGEALPWRERGPWCGRCRAAVVASSAVRLVGHVPVTAAWLYGGAVADAIVRCKAGKVLPDLGSVAPEVIAAARRLDLGDLDLHWIAVAPEKTRLRRRGFHLPDLVAAALARRTGGRLVRALDRLDASPPRNQGEGTVPQFRALGSTGAKRAIVVDDVVTTGQTLTAASDLLAQAGWLVAGAVCLADARPAVVAAGLDGGGATA
jgi:predicted amidophosphoribosyltransferase